VWTEHEWQDGTVELTLGAPLAVSTPTGLWEA
jgi:hypothetical protein